MVPKDGDAENQNVLLVIATLIAAVTFQPGVNPPGGIWQDNKEGHLPGKAIYASQPEAFYVFLISNTIALCASILVIISIIISRISRSELHFYLEMVTATVAMLVTYAAAIFAVTPHYDSVTPLDNSVPPPANSVTPHDDPVRFRCVLTAGALPFIVRGLIYFYKRKVKKLGDGNGTGTV